MRLIFSIVLGCLVLAGCKAAIDPDHARLCRIVLPAIEEPDATLRIIQQTQTSPKTAPEEVLSLTYNAESLSGERRVHIVECAFDPAVIGTSVEQLTLVTRDHHQLSAAQMLYLKRFWLETSESAISDPQPVQGADQVPLVNFPTAYLVQHLLNGLPLVAIYSLLAAAYSLIFGLVGRINLAFGELAALGGYAALFGIMVFSGSSIPAVVAGAIAFALFAAAMHGGVLSRWVFLPLSRATGQQALVGTIGLAVFLQEYLRLTQGSELRWAPPVFNEPIALLRAPHFVTTLTPIALIVSVLALGVASALLILMKTSRFGRDWRAYSDDPKAAQLFGIDPRALFINTFALSCGIAGLAGAIMTLFYGGVGYGASTALGLKALIAAILGGIGSVPGAFLGGLIVGEVEALWSAYFPIVYRDLVVYCLLSVILILRPGGLLGFPMLLPRGV